MSSERPRLDRLGGGFIALRWRANRLEAFSDVLGLRSLHWMRAEGGMLFSTRVDWLAAMVGGLEADWDALGSHWLAYNQLSHRSLVRGVSRLGPGGHLILTSDEARIEHHPYSPRTGEHHETLSALLAAQLKSHDERTVSLGLSGGMDSRTLLALKPRRGRFGIHVFGAKSLEDVEVALSIAEEGHLPYSHFHVPPSDRHELLRTVADHAVQAQSVSPASAALSLRYYAELRSQRKLVVDGGFGEIVRRQFMNRLLRRGSRAIREHDGRAALAHVRFDRAFLFREAVRRKLEVGAVEDMASLLRSMGEWLDLGLENVVDLMTVRTRLPNFYGFEQARLDTQVQNYMPFAHPRLLDAVFSIPPRRRRRGRISRRIIASNAPRLRRYPLVKSDVSYPYGLPPLMSAIAVKLTRRFGETDEPPDRTLVLTQLKEYMMDRIGSADVRNDDAYDHATLASLADAYYRDGNFGSQLDWWLAFDFWRRAVEQPGRLR